METLFSFLNKVRHIIMSHKFFFIILFLAVSFYALTQSTDKNNLKYGKYNVGFQTIRLKGKNEYPLLISLWYPATAGGAKICLRDYIIAGALTTDIADTVSIHQFRRVLELPFLFHLDKIPDADFEKLLSTQFKACKDASIQKQKFPLLIVQATSDNYIEMFEFLASHGFIVAGITTSWKDQQNDTLLYVNATNILEELLNFMVKQSYVDTSRIAGFGHGGGIQPAFYLAMRTLRIKLLVNLDGGVFGPRSKTTLSPDYAPSRLKIPMLHIITQSQRKEDNEVEFNALSNPR